MYSRIISSLRRFTTSTDSQKKVCIVGSGPAGFYFAQHLLKTLPSVHVDIYEKLPVPFGLVRYGVAPDHPEVKNVINTFSKTAKSPNLRFFGNVDIGKDIRVKELQEAYHAVVYAFGCSGDKLLGVPGEGLQNCLSARRFVGWYNGHPDDRNLEVDLKGKAAVVLGQGNVAIDVARILLSPVDELKKTDITEYSLEALSGSKVEKVYLVGRRGPLQAAFTIKEFREMTKLQGVQTLFRNEQLSGVEDLLAGLQRPRKRLTELMLKVSKEPQQGQRAFHPLFLRKPIKILGTTSVTGVKLAANRLSDPLKGVVEPLPDEEELPCELVLRSIGYQGTCPDPDIPWDSNGGRVLQAATTYSTGWINSGPVGVLLSTMNNAFSQAEALAAALVQGSVGQEQKEGFEAVRGFLKKKSTPVVSWEGWEKIDRVEADRGSSLGKPREKIVSIDLMVEIGGQVL